ncbi:MAG: DMT family transporter [Candidatus Aenigmatarchaeota archaeon]
MDISIGILFGMVALFGWGASDFCVAKSARGASPFKAFFWSQLVALSLMLPIFLLFFRLPQFSFAVIALLAISGILSAVSNFSFYKSLQVGKVSIVMPVGSCWAVVTVLLSLTLLHEVLTATQAFGISLAIGGAVLVSFKWKDLMRFRNRTKGLNYAVIAALAFGADFVVIDLLVSEIGWFLPVFFVSAITAFFLFLYSGAAKKDISFPKNILLFIILVGALDTVAYLSYSSGVTSEYSAIVAPIGAASPAVSIILARIFFKEKLHFNQKIGAVSVLAGLILLSL